MFLDWTLGFLIFALVAAVLGFWGLAGTAASIAKILFVGFLLVYAVTFIMKLLKNKA